MVWIPDYRSPGVTLEWALAQRFTTSYTSGKTDVQPWDVVNAANGLTARGDIRCSQGKAVRNP